MTVLVTFVRSILAGANVAQGVNIVSNLPSWLRSVLMLAALGLVTVFGFNLVNRVF